MKIFKKNEQALMVKIFGLENRFFLTATVMLFFDLNDPDGLLTEQELWKIVPDQLGPTQALDMGMPKGKVEVLVSGSCFAPQARPHRALDLSFKVGPVSKRLSVFGDRTWKDAGGFNYTITEPRPFVQMPLTYEHAFGGRDHAPNPVGKGVRPVQEKDGKFRHPLPNIEDPKKLIGSPDDRPEPAGCGPLDITWPQRAGKRGTYDDQWFRTRWPHFPDDLDLEFFNLAPRDQFTEHLVGNETIELVNLHPNLPVIQSRLPGRRIRCFVTKRKSLKVADADEHVFQEVTTHIDTVWLFPNILRGVVMYRGSTEVLDDEFADVVRVFLSTEKLGDTPNTLEYYLDAQKKALDLTVPMDLAPLEKAQKKVAQALKKIKALPKDIETAKKKVMGQAPKMPLAPLSEMKGQSEAVLGGGLTVLSKVEAQAQALHAQFGHLVRIPLDSFGKLRQKIQRIHGKVDQTVSKLEKTQAEAETAKKDLGAQLKAKLSPQELAQAGIDPDHLIPEKKVNPWHDRGFPMVVQARRELEQNSSTLTVLSRLGFTRKTLKRGWIGLLPGAVGDDRKKWGLQGNPGPGPDPMVLPAGLFLPRFDGATLNRILIRPLAEGAPDWSLDDPDRDILVEGSAESPLFLPAEEGAPVVRVGDELAARYVDQEIGDACSVIVLKEPGEKPDEPTSGAIEEALAMLVILAPAEENDWPSWSKAFPKAQKLTLPEGRTVFDLRKIHIDLRRWIMEALPPGYSAKHQIEFGLPEPGKHLSGSPVAGLAIPKMDVKSMVQKAIAEIRTGLKPGMDAAQSQKQEIQDQVRKQLVRFGQDPDQALTPPKEPVAASFKETGQQIAQKIQAEKERLRNLGLLNPEAESKMDQAAAQAAKEGQKFEKQYQDGMAKLEAGKKKAAEAKQKAKAGEPPEKAAQKLKAAGLDPDKVRKRTREEVIDMHARGESLALAILSGVDLSNLDLTGIDLTQAQLRKTNLAGTNLEGACLDRAMAQDADFSGACLKSAQMDSGLFMRASFKKADLAGVRIKMALMKGADLTGADLTGARLDATTFQKATLTGANLSRCEARLSIFADGDLSDADFRDILMEKCLFNRSVLDRTDFRGARLDSTVFMKVKGQNVHFEGSNLHKVRFVQGVELTGANFLGASMEEAFFKEANFSQALFCDCRMNAALIEKCDLTRADFYHAVAIGCRFDKSDLEKARMRGVNLFQGSFRKARLVETDLTGSNLYGVDFLKATLGKTKFELANLKATQLYLKTDLLK